MELKDKLILQLDNQYFPLKGSTLVVAVSGGVDSVVLLYVLLLLSAKLDWQLIVAHFNHQLRKAADADAKFVKNLAKSWGLKFVLGSTNVKKLAVSKKLTIEEAGRTARYDWLQKIARQFGVQAIVTAHTRDDQAETIIMNWLRGGLVRALSGMRAKENNIWRPFLEISKTELIQFAKHYHIQFREDKSNRDIIYTRNLIRHKLWPVLEQVNQGFAGVLARNAESWANLEDWLDQQLDDIYKKVSIKSQIDEVVLSEKRFRELNPFWQNELLLLVIQKLKGDRQDIKKVHLDEALATLASRQPWVWKQLPGKLFLSRGYGKISVSPYPPKFVNK